MAEKDDPVLVRPYVKAVAEAEQAPDEKAAETWPEPAAPPEDGSATLEQPAVTPEPPAEQPTPPRTGLHPLARLGIFSGGVALALGVVGYLIFGPASEPGALRPGAALPAAPGQAPLGPLQSGAAASGQPSATGSVSPSTSASASLSASPSPSLSAASPDPSLQTLVPAVPSGSTPPPATADPTLAPPAADRTGSITAASGRCLARGGLLGVDGSPVNVAGCLSVPTQSFTLAADGTLRVSGRCAQASGDGAVRIAACGDSDAAQWRAGPGGTLVTADGRCLTDPGRAGAATSVSGCSGADSQRWTLP
ncbi:ricin-type beta-trefoil lectin domain protein [Actinoplanes sp. URMC 104]